MNLRKRSPRAGKRDPDVIAFARDQRAVANEFAQDVWQMVRNRRCRGQKFRREYPIPPYTVDFCCVALKLVIEVDGEHHQTDEGRQHDQRRDQFLTQAGYKVLRIPGYEVLRDVTGVKRQIESSIDAAKNPDFHASANPPKRIEPRGASVIGTDSVLIKSRDAEICPTSALNEKAQLASVYTA